MVSDTAGNLYMAFTDPSNSKLSVKKYDGTTWATLGATYASDTNVFAYSLAVDRAGTPYIALKEVGAGASMAERVVVKKFNGSTWEMMGSTHFFNASSQVGIIQIISDVPGTVYLAYNDDESGSQYTIRQFNGTDWQSIPVTFPGTGSFCPIAMDGFGVLYAASAGLVWQYGGGAWDTYVLGTYFGTSSAVAQKLIIDKNYNPVVLYTYGDGNYRVAAANPAWAQLPVVEN